MAVPFASPTEEGVGVMASEAGEGRAFAAPTWIGSSGLEKLRPRRPGEGESYVSAAYP